MRLNTEVTPALAESIAPDVLLVAVGASPVVPPIAGIESDNVIIGNDLYLKRDQLGEKVAVLGGGLVGCETAVHLAQEGRDVTVVEMLDELCPDANGRHRPLLLAELDKLVKGRTGLRGKRVTKDGLECVDGDGKEVFIEADTIVVAVGQRALRGVAESLRDCAPEVYEIGDCVKPAQVTQAVFRGHFAALDI